MTKDEGDRIAVRCVTYCPSPHFPAWQQCFKEPEFKELFHEYLDEMSGIEHVDLLFIRVAHHFTRVCCRPQKPRGNGHIHSST